MANDMSDGAVRQLPILKPSILSRGTLVTSDLKRARALYEEFLGLECVEVEPGRMLARDRDPNVLRQRGGGVYWVMDIREATGGPASSLLKHWGIDVGSSEEVDRVHAFATEHKDRLGLKAVRKPRLQHGTYSFYVEDLDNNWWEVESRPGGESNDEVFDRGDEANWTG